MFNTRSWVRSLALLIGLTTIGSSVLAQQEMRVEPTRIHPVRPHAKLVIEHIAHMPAPHHAGASIRIEVLVKNDGDFKSSGREELHYKCKNSKANGPSCSMPDGKRLLPAIEPGESYSAQSLTTPNWKAGKYEFSAWIVVPGMKTRADVHTATLEVLPSGKPQPPGDSMSSAPQVPGSDKMFNPQPEPPGKGKELPAVQNTAPRVPGSDVKFNPQPEPPPEGAKELPAVQRKVPTAPGAETELNPQPEPPSEAKLPAVQIPAEFQHLLPLPHVMRLRDPHGGLKLRPSDQVAEVGGADAAKVSPASLKPDLIFTIGVYGGGTLYPVAVQAKNQGLKPSQPSSFRMICDEYTGLNKTGKCLSTINATVPALQPGGAANLSLPFAPPLDCDPQHTGVSVCIVTAKIDVDNQNSESNEDNNTQVFAIYPQ